MKKNKPIHDISAIITLIKEEKTEKYSNDIRSDLSGITPFLTSET